MPTRRDVDVARFPGGELIAAGLRDLAEGIESVPALLVSIATRRLRGLGLEVPPPLQNAELRLYALLAAEDSDTAHGRYNALVRRLVSFTRAAERYLARLAAIDPLAFRRAVERAFTK